MSQPDFVIEYLDPKTLGENPFQFRRHPDSQKSALSASVKEFGWVDGPLLNKRTGHLIDGHLRRDEAIAQGRATIPVKVVDLSEADERRLLRLFDPLTMMATQDEEALASLIAEIGDPDLEALLGELESSGGLLPDADPDALPEAVETRCKAGDLWRLGEHRLLVSDCTDVTAVERLMDGERAAFVFTDPPYDVDYGADSYSDDRSEKWGKIENDNLGREFPDFCREWVSCLDLAVASGAIYVCAPFRPSGWVIRHALEERYSFKDTIVWVKDHFVVGRNDYHPQYENLFYYVKGERVWNGGRDQSNVWSYARVLTDRAHPTQKPVEMVARALENSSNPGALAYDPFLGSGTTLIAAQQVGRRCYGLEVEPRYADVCIQRWENVTGLTAELC